MLVKLAVVLLVFSALEQAVGSDNTDIHDSPPEKPASQKGRLSLQNTGKKQGSGEMKNERILGWLGATWGLSGHVFLWLQIKACRRRVLAILSNPLFVFFQLKPFHTTGAFRSAFRKAIFCKYSQTVIQYVSKLLIERHKVIGNVYGCTSRCARALANACARVIGKCFQR